MFLKNKAAVVTGGSKGIGYSVAKALLENGASVFICGRNKSDVTGALERLSEHGQVGGTACDVRNEEEVRKMLAESAQTLGGVD